MIEEWKGQSTLGLFAYAGESAFEGQPVVSFLTCDLFIFLCVRPTVTATTTTVRCPK